MLRGRGWILGGQAGLACQLRVGDAENADLDRPDLNDS